MDVLVLVLLFVVACMDCAAGCFRGRKTTMREAVKDAVKDEENESH